MVAKLVDLHRLAKQPSTYSGHHNRQRSNHNERPRFLIYLLVESLLCRYNGPNHIYYPMIKESSYYLVSTCTKSSTLRVLTLTHAPVGIELELVGVPKEDGVCTIHPYSRKKWMSKANAERPCFARSVVLRVEGDGDEAKQNARTLAEKLLVG